MSHTGRPCRCRSCFRRRLALLLAVECPTCEAAAGSGCVTLAPARSGPGRRADEPAKRAVSPHIERIRAASALAAEVAS